MSLYQFIIRILARNAIPIGQSIYRAYRHVMKGAHHTTRTSVNYSEPRHPMDEFFVRMFETGKDFTTTPPLNQNMALKILDINGRVEDVKAREVLDRYYALYKKNDIENGGSPYLLSKVYSAKECLMERFPNALEEEEKFYNEVVKPEEEAE